jgi:hypothetical protein
MICKRPANRSTGQIPIIFVIVRGCTERFALPISNSDASAHTRPDNDPHRKGWFVYCGDVRVGHIGIRAGVSVDSIQWGWSCGFHPGCDPGEQTHGSAKSFEEARSDFEAAWNNLAPKKTEAHLEMWRRSRDFHAWKERMWGEKCQISTQRTDGRSHCFCGAAITTASILSISRKRTAALGIQPRKIHFQLQLLVTLGGLRCSRRRTHLPFLKAGLLAGLSKKSSA